jgi:pimeloyl-ACP methyl ester carboxylesterase
MIASGGLGLLGGGAGILIDNPWHRPGPKTTGFQLREWISPLGDSRKYLLFVPYHRDPPESLPLILFLNGFGENGSDGRMQLAENFGIAIWQMKDRFPFAVLAPQCRPQGRWKPGSGDVDDAIALMDHLKHELPIDEDRTYLTGVSTGGAASWEIAAQVSDRFAAMVPVASAGPANGRRDVCQSLAAANIPIWAFYNRFDGVSGVVSFNQKMQHDLLEFGQSPIFIDYPDHGHNCWDRAYRTPAIYTWLLSQRRDQNKKPHRKFSLLTSQAFALLEKRGSPANWKASADYGVTCSTERHESDSYLLSSASPREISIHCEVYIDNTISTGIVVRAWPTAEGLLNGWKLVLNRADSGSSGILSIDQRKWFAVCDSISQSQLLMNSWADVRVDISDKQLAVSLNGYPAINAALGDELDRPGRFGLAFAAARPGAHAEWRRIRIAASNP